MKKPMKEYDRGVKEVVGWMLKNGENVMEDGTDTFYWGIQEEEWLKKLKEWGIEK